jgi:hypothetical protein
LSSQEFEDLKMGHSNSKTSRLQCFRDSKADTAKVKRISIRLSTDDSWRSIEPTDIFEPDHKSSAEDYDSDDTASPKKHVKHIPTAWQPRRSLKTL